MTARREFFASPAPDTARREDDWRLSGTCNTVDPELFYPDHGDHGAAKRAKAICNECPVRAECLEFALKNDERFGIWGGTSESDREVLRRKRPKPETGKCGRGHDITAEGAKSKDGKCRQCRLIRARGYDAERRARRDQEAAS